MIASYNFQKCIHFALDNLGDSDKWDSLIVNKRKPHTYRAFIFDGKTRICLHRFERCTTEESFYHPHPWESEILILRGRYRQAIGFTPNREDRNPQTIMDMILSAGSFYTMTNPLGWHKVTPITTCYSLMVNFESWDDQHSNAPRTKGKDLDKFTEDELQSHLHLFSELLEEYDERQ